jgi:hypothetical protein
MENVARITEELHMACHGRLVVRSSKGIVIIGGSMSAVTAQRRVVSATLSDVPSATARAYVVLAKKVTHPSGMEGIAVGVKITVLAHMLVDVTLVILATS